MAGSKGYGKKGGLTGSCPAPDFARAKSAPRTGQLASSQPRPKSSGQVKAPADQGGRSEGSAKS